MNHRLTLRIRIISPMLSFRQIRSLTVAIAAALALQAAPAEAATKSQSHKKSTGTKMVVTKAVLAHASHKAPAKSSAKSSPKSYAKAPAQHIEIAKIEPVYESVPGWNTSTFGISDYDDLPARAKDYIAFLESRTGVEVGCISTGPERNHTIVRAGSRFAELVG